MEVASQVTFRGFQPTEGLKAHIQKKAQALEKYCDRITRCRVMVGAIVPPPSDGESLSSPN